VTQLHPDQVIVVSMADGASDRHSRCASLER
jgi:hypothetical protein